MSLEEFSQKELEKMTGYEKEAERIQKKLSKFLGAEKAREVGADIYGMALDIDGYVDRILADKRVLEKYEYDGEIFELKDGAGIHKVPNGIMFLKKAASDQNIESFFRMPDDPEAVLKNFIKWLEKYVLMARANCRNWEEHQKLGFVSREVAKQVAGKQKSRGNKSQEFIVPMSEKDKKFFDFYEKQMTDDEIDPPKQ